jgi:hypothetical protein
MNQRKAVIQDCRLRASAALIDAAAFAYLCTAFEMLFFILAMNVTHQSSYLTTPNEFLWVGLALAGIFWAVGFASFLSPASSLFVAIYIGCRYWIRNDLPGEHHLIMTWYFLSVIISLISGSLYRRTASWSMGRKLLKISVDRTQRNKRKSNQEVSRDVLSFFVVPELLEAFLEKKENLQRSQETEVPNLPRWVSLVTLLSIILGIIGGCLWRVPLIIGARETEFKTIKKNDLVSSKLPIVWWLYAGDGIKALQVAESQLSREVEQGEAVSKDEVITLLFWIDKADRAGYCSSKQWNELSGKVTPHLASWIGSCSSTGERHLLTGIAKYLSDGYIRHGSYSDAEKIDQLQMASTLKTHGSHSAEFMHSLYNSAVFHSRVKNYAKALEQFKLIVKEGDLSNIANRSAPSAEITKAKEQIVLLGSKPIHSN